MWTEWNSLGGMSVDREAIVKRGLKEMPKRNKRPENWTASPNDEFRDLYSSLVLIRMIKSRRVRWARRVARMSVIRNAYKVMVGRTDRKILLARPRSRWEENIEIYLKIFGGCRLD
jgi:hypothetical protein